MIVDFKTSKNAAHRQSRLRDNPQLGLYQLAVDEGGFDDAVGDGARSGGAELVQLRVDKDGFPKVQPQAPQTPGLRGRKTIEVQLDERRRRRPPRSSPPTANSYCARCDFQHVCPTQQRTGTVLS